MAILIFLLHTAFTLKAQAQGAKGAYNAVLKSMIHGRCDRYLSENGKEGCKNAVSVMLKILDYDVILFNQTMPNLEDKAWDPRSFVFVAFKKRLLDLLSAPRTKIYLESLNLHLNNYLLGIERELTIYDFTKNFYKSDDEALEVIATLFQDTTFRKLHLAYLEETDIKINLPFESNKELLSRVIDMIGLVLDSSEENYKKLFYPGNLHKNFNRNIYQFYVPYFLTKTLLRSGIRPEDGASAAMMLTLSYEFITSSHDYRFLFTDPSSIESLHKIKDIFAGHCGVTLGTRGLNAIKPFEEVRRAFNRSSSEGVVYLFKK